MRQPIPMVRKAEEELAAVAAAIRADHEAARQSGTESAEHARSAGERLARVKDRLTSEGRWLKWLKDEVGVSQRAAWNYLKIHQEWGKLADYAYLGLHGCLNFLRTGKTGEEDDEEDEENSLPEYVTVDQWNEADEELRAKLLSVQGNKTFNAQGENENIEWALWSWNPVTGCLHNCPYCYARDMATMGPTSHAFPNGFTPTLIPARLKAPQNTSFPEAKAAEWMGHQNVFVCSMADLFGRWVPSEWINAVLREVREASQWNFLFLTKFPIRMAEFDFPDNAWVGTTVDCQARVANAEKAFRKVKAGVRWLSCEPMIEPLVFKDLSAFDWIVLGGASRSSQTPEWHPPRAWVNAIEEEALRLGVKVYEKTNLLERVRQYPGLVTEIPEQAPEALRYLPGESK